MYQIHYLNPISPKGTAMWTDNYEKAADMNAADAVMVRSAAMHDLDLPENLLAVARVIKGLMLRDGERGLSTGERKMLHSAKEILISEIVLSQSASYEDVEQRINTALA